MGDLNAYRRSIRSRIEERSSYLYFVGLGPAGPKVMVACQGTTQRRARPALGRQPIRRGAREAADRRLQATGSGSPFASGTRAASGTTARDGVICLLYAPVSRCTSAC